LETELGPEAVQAMRALKAALDQQHPQPRQDPASGMRAKSITEADAIGELMSVLGQGERQSRRSHHAIPPLVWLRPIG
jgi:hypothetical protein